VAREKSNIAPRKIMVPIAKRVTIMIRTEERETNPFLQKLKKPDLSILFAVVKNIRV
jgi:hypothetical protein